MGQLGWRLDGRAMELVKVRVVSMSKVLERPQIDDPAYMPQVKDFFGLCHNSADCRLFGPLKVLPPQVGIPGFQVRILSQIME